MQSPLSKHLEGRRLILASGSPRRRELLVELGLEFTLGQISDYDESYPATLTVSEIPAYIAEQKSMHYTQKLKKEDILITSDTIVTIDGEILGKPKDKAEATKMLKELSGRTHQVYTGLCLRSKDKTITFSDCCDVTFDFLSDEDIEYYIEEFKPFDKAGAYGIQEWIGLACIKEIKGSVYTVIGLPVQQLYQALFSF